MYQNTDMPLHAKRTMISDNNRYSIRPNQSVENIPFGWPPDFIKLLIVGIWNIAAVAKVNQLTTNITDYKKGNPAFRFRRWNMITICD